MYKLLVADSDFSIKTYWCSDLSIAKEVSRELQQRFRRNCSVVEVPEKLLWQSDSDSAEPFKLKNNIEIYCSFSELRDAIYHSRNNILKIKAADEIFCCEADEDLICQRRELSECFAH